MEVQEREKRVNINSCLTEIISDEHFRCGSKKYFYDACCNVGDKAYDKQAINIEHGYSRFYTFQYVNGVVLKMADSSVLVIYLTLVPKHSLENFQSTYRDGNKCKKKVDHGDEKPYIGHPKC